MLNCKSALVVGVDKYKSKGLEDLPSAHEDAKLISHVLSNLGYQAYKKTLVSSELRGRNLATKIKEIIQNFFNQSEPPHTLLFYFSGHGVLKDKRVYLALPGIDKKDQGIGGFPLDHLTEFMSISKSTNIVAIIDACYSGAANLPNSNQRSNSVSEQALSGYGTLLEKARISKGRCFMLSSQPYEAALAYKNKNSIYTKFIIEGLKGVPYTIDPYGKSILGSVDNYGNVTPVTLHNFVYFNVGNVVRQTPKIKFDQSGEIIMASYPGLAIKPVHKGISNVKYSNSVSVQLVSKHPKYINQKHCFDRIQQLRHQNTSTPSSIYWKGLVLELHGEYNEAQELYNKADSLLSTEFEGSSSTSKEFRGMNIDLNKLAADLAQNFESRGFTVKCIHTDKTSYPVLNYRLLVTKKSMVRTIVGITRQIELGILGAGNNFRIRLGFKNNKRNLAMTSLWYINPLGLATGPIATGSVYLSLKVFERQIWKEINRSIVSLRK